MNALMKGFRKMVADQKAKQDKLIAEQQSEIKKFTEQVQTKNEEVHLLKAKVEKKKFKSTESKKLVAKVQSDQEAIFGAKRQVEDKL